MAKPLESEMESEKELVIFHKHICFLCCRSYEQVEGGKCHYSGDHRWGKCPQCEDNFGIKDYDDGPLSTS
jgi:hypothetical protein